MLLAQVNGSAVGCPASANRSSTTSSDSTTRARCRSYVHEGLLGASLATSLLAHLRAALLEFGEMDAGANLPAAAVLRKLGLKPLTLQSKEGLGLINGTQFMVATVCVPAADRDKSDAHHNIGAAMTLEAARGRYLPTMPASTRPARIRAGSPSRATFASC